MRPSDFRIHKISSEDGLTLVSYSSSSWTASLKLLGREVREKAGFMNSGKQLHLILKLFNSITWAILLQITCKSKEPEIICSRFFQTPGHLGSSKATDSTILSKHITLPFKVLKSNDFYSLTASLVTSLKNMTLQWIVLLYVWFLQIPSSSHQHCHFHGLIQQSLKLKLTLTISKSNINSTPFTELRAAKDPGMLQELVKAISNRTLLAYPSMTSEHRTLYQYCVSTLNLHIINFVIIDRSMP